MPAIYSDPSLILGRTVSKSRASIFFFKKKKIVNLDNKQQFRFENAEYFMICQKTKYLFRTGNVSRSEGLFYNLLFAIIIPYDFFSLKNS